MADKAVSKSVKGSKPNEFFRGDERGYDGGDKTIVSPVASIFNPVTVLSTNCMDKELSAQSVHGSGKKGRK